MARVPPRSSRTSPGSSGASSGFGGITFGGRVPPIIGVLIVATFVASIVGVVGARHGFPLLAWTALIPAAVRQGQLWRGFTWVFFETEPMALVFACLSLFWFGRDLALRWGPGRFVLNYLGLAVVVGALVTGISFIYPSIAGAGYLGTWPIQEALIILWASYYPSRQLMFPPLAGRQIVVGTIVMTAVFALYSGIDLFIPHFIAEALALLIVYAPMPRTLWLEAKLRGMEKQRRASHLKSVPRTLSDDEDPPSGGRWLN